MKQVILKNWTFSRLFRFAIGAAIIVQAILEKNIMLGIAGTLFAGMAVFDIGCCAAGGCYVPTKKIPKTKDPASYEEVV